MRTLGVTAAVLVSVAAGTGTAGAVESKTATVNSSPTTGPTTAGTVEPRASCTATTGRVCLWDHYYFVSGRSFSWVTIYVGDAANDKASSLSVGPAADPASPYVYFYQHNGYGGNSLIFRGGNSQNDLRNIAMNSERNWDDEISSVWG